MLCQEVCPQNERVKPMPVRTDIGNVGASIPVLGILSMDETQYRTQYRDNQMTRPWIRFPAIQRNALLCLGHLHDKKAVPVLQTYLRSSDPVLAQTAGWALSRIAHG